MTATKNQIENFLSSFRSLVQKNGGRIEFVKREDLTKTVASLGINEKIATQIIMNDLTPQDYSSGPLEEDNKDRKKIENGTLWIFGNDIDGTLAYIKLKKAFDKKGRKEIPKCIGFHKATDALDFPKKNKLNLWGIFMKTGETYNKFCPNCMKEVIAKHVRVKDVIEVKDEKIEIESDVLKCNSCKSTFNSEEFPASAIDKAFNKYREKHKLLMPIDFKSFRDKLGITQKELGTLLGWGEVTLSRYESGALQTVANDRAFRMAMTCEGLNELLKSARNEISSTVIARVKKFINEEKHLSEIYRITIDKTSEQYEMHQNKSKTVIKKEKVGIYVGRPFFPNSKASEYLKGK